MQSLSVSPESPFDLKDLVRSVIVYRFIKTVPFTRLLARLCPSYTVLTIKGVYALDKLWYG